MNRDQHEARMKILRCESCLSYASDICEKPQVEISCLKELNFSGYRTKEFFCIKTVGGVCCIKMADSVL